MIFRRHLLRGVFVFLTFAATLMTVSSSAYAQELGQDDLRGLIQSLADGDLNERATAIDNLVSTGDPRIVPALEALEGGDLYVRESDGLVIFGDQVKRRVINVIDPLTQEVLEAEASSRAYDKIRVNNALRRQIRAGLGSLTLRAADARVRLEAAEAIFKSQDPGAIEPLRAALESEDNARVRSAMEQALYAAILASDEDDGAKVEAVEKLAAFGSRDVLSVLSATANDTDGVVQEAALTAIASVEQTLALWGIGQNVWQGISLGSVLLLAAIGLAITFGVMGVINMAHGEMVMLGAYTTFVVQEIIRTSAPGLFDWSLAIALPLAFLVAGTVGFAIERGVIRFLYGRPLETLLATWGISLILQQAVRSLFGPTNREVGNPSWMSGAFEVGQMTITYNRLWIVVFSLVVFAALLILTKRLRFGLQMRAVTLNRPMAASMGVRTPWVDALTFALGSGIAGIAGVALSQIDNVSPNLGQSYIIDSFMVVVFGGVGNLWGTLVGAMTLGIVNKFLEPYAGAVLGKILVLVFIILFIQKRPRGLFALKGRAVEQ